MVLCLRAIAACFAALPHRAALALGTGMGWVYGSLIRYHRRDALDALRRAFPEKSPAELGGIVRGMYRHLGRNMAEFLRMLGGRADELDALVTVSGVEHVQEALRRGRGALALVSHLGNWELLTVEMARRFQPSGGIFKDFRQGALTDYLVEARKAHNVMIFPQRNAYRACLKALRENALIGFVLDQNMIWKEGVFVEFFGRPACTSPGLAHLSAHAGAPVVPIFTHREPGGGHVIHIQPPLEPPVDRKPEAIREATQRYTALIEAAIREHPEQWIWIHRRWRTTPEKARQQEEARRNEREMAK